MGAWMFHTYSKGSDPDTAFRRAVDQAVTEHGHGGYSGTIAEKNDYVIITKQVMSCDEAMTTANALLDTDDPRIADKWGPAGAIPVLSPTRTRRPDSPHPPADPATGNPATSVTQPARQRRANSDTEAVTSGYRAEGSSPPATVAADRGAPVVRSDPDGWLFFGWASS